MLAATALLGVTVLWARVQTAVRVQHRQLRGVSGTPSAQRSGQLV